MNLKQLLSSRPWQGENPEHYTSLHSKEWEMAVADMIKNQIDENVLKAIGAQTLDWNESDL